MNGLFLIINPASGYGRGNQVWKKVKKELEKKKISFRSFYTEYAGHAEVLARQIATLQNYRLKTVIGIGGEGTINEIVNGLSSFNKIEMGFIYAGVKSRSLANFSLTSHPVRAIKYLVQRMNRPLKRYDFGEYLIEGKNAKKYFFNRLGIGLMAKVLESLKGQEKQKVPILGHVRFMASFLKVLWNYEPFTLSLKVNNDESSQYDSVWFMMISNRQNQYVRMKIAPKASFTDGYLDVTLIKGISRFKLLVLLLFNRVGNQTKQGSVIEFTCEKITISSNSSQVIHADGDLIGESPVTVKIDKSHDAYLL